MTTTKHEFTLDEVLQGKATRIKSKDYRKTSDYLNPFLDRMSKYTDNFTVKVKMPDQITLTDDGNVVTDDLTFNRVNIEAILPQEYAFEGHTQVIGMVYGLDVRKPICKLYSGAERSACTNLCVFSPSGLNIQEIDADAPLDYKPIESLLNRTETVSKTLRMLSETEFVNSDININESLGRWIRNARDMEYSSGYGKVKIKTTMVIDAYADLFENTDSEYFVNYDEPTTMFNVYNAFTQQITNDWDKDCFTRFEKTLLIGRILGI
jgi:hypothetical protein